MSNVTDGKTALKAGDFQKAEKKFLRALDTHPDDGEIWWALMLCKYECRNDEELKEKLVREFSHAARSGGKQPSLPLDTPYGANALRYAKGESGDRRRLFVTKLDAELDEIWRAERGGSIKRREVKTRAPRKKMQLSAVTTYVAIALAAVFGGVAAYGVFASAWMIWTGLGLFAAAEAVAAWSIVSATRRGEKIIAAKPLAVTTGTVVGIAVFASAFVTNNRPVLIVTAIIICISAAVAVFELIPRKGDGKGNTARTEKPQKQKSEKQPRKSRPDFEDDFD